MSLKGNDWCSFASDVASHIENYCVPQYGDKPNDVASSYTLEELNMQMKRYLARQGKNARPGQEKLDLLKIAHYAQMSYTLIEEQENAKK
jgi:hypothetical protein